MSEPSPLFANRPERKRRRDRSGRGPPSDVVRFRGVLLAALLGLVTLGVVLSLDLGANGALSKGPLSGAHQRAAPGCASCHASEPVSKSCSGCHEGQRSARPGHAALFARGELGCTGCHRAHGPDQIRFDPGGRVTRVSDGIEHQLAVSGLAFRPAQPITLPLISIGACGRCHALSDPKDAAAGCRLGDADRGVVGCFDEHLQRPERAVAWQPAVEAVSLAPGRPVGIRARPALWLAGALLTSAFGLFLARRTPARKSSETRPEERVALPPARLRLPRIDTATCLGCYACVDACPYDVLEVKRYVAVVERPDDCCGLTLCEQRCPNRSLVVTTERELPERIRVSHALESEDTEGLYLAGDLTGLPLIRNALDQGAHVARQVAEKVAAGSPAPRRQADELLDLLIVGSGPAGLSAGLCAQARGLSVLILEQGSLAESIRSFPRRKIVLTEPSSGPHESGLWLEECEKEDLLSQWTRVVKTRKLPIRERHRVTGVAKESTGFRVRALDADQKPIELGARHVLLAVGRRGTPRKLDAAIVPGAAGSVHYALADARSFQGQRVLVVGLGDSALEAVIALARQPGTRVSVSYHREGFRRGKARNIQAVKRLSDLGLVDIVWNSRVVRVEETGARLEAPEGQLRVPCDAVLAFLGALAPWEFLEECGVRREGRLGGVV